ncbi:uncharacterized protein [Amphiura filiformis]|uniref:uncharacterized protein n=1 Tax=Amphiura filiformis TaxID=82378 RepID=UPI003B2205CF
MAAHSNAMGSFGDDKLKAMEEEMNRFEQEISGGPGDALPHGFPPGRGHHPGIPGMSAPSGHPGHGQYPGISTSGPPAATVSVPGMTRTATDHSNHGNRPSITATIRGFVPKPQMLTSVRPEVGPQLPSSFGSRPAFVPHQVRPMPHFMPRGGGGFHPPPPGMMHPGLPGPMHRPPMMMRPQMAPTVISAPPTVYSAKPVKFSTKKKEETEEETKESDTASKTPAATTQAPMLSGPSIQQAPPAPPAMPTPVMPTHIMPRQVSMPPMASNPAMTPYMMVQQNPVVAQTIPPQGDLMMEQPGSSQMTAAEKKKEKKKKFVRIAAETTWEDDSLTEWDPNDFRIFCGDIGNEVTDELLTKVFCKYPSFLKAKVVRDKRTNKTKGYGFVSFKDPGDFANAMRELNGKYVGNRPIKLRKSNWKDRNIDTYKKKQREKQRLGLR